MSSLRVAASISSLSAQTETNSSGVSSLASWAAASASSIAAEAVEQHGARPVRVLDRGPLTAGGASRMVASISGDASASRP